ncbi:hypothetical protein GCM10020369_84270 [Cryptosporangium minutisporangium]|uniref:Uncharacterized protein n=1 Tax=Cryptosporangium minutisporangium TaxID=113569 RepID=A0ABP6TDD3_9ACTN
MTEPARPPSLRGRFVRFRSWRRSGSAGIEPIPAFCRMVSGESLDSPDWTIMQILIAIQAGTQISRD